MNDLKSVLNPWITFLTPALFFMQILLFSSCGYTHKSKEKKDANSGHPEYEIPVLDVTATFPKREIILQDIADVDYIPLETTEEVLLTDRSLSIRYVSENTIVMANARTGYCYIFDSKGRIQSVLYRKGNGGEEYLSMFLPLVDEKTKEIYISDLWQKKIQVYSFDGQYMRTLPLPEGIAFSSPYIYDSESIICYDSNVGTETERNQPFILISRKDGSINKSIDITLDNRISTVLFHEGENGATMAVMLSVRDIIRHNHDFIMGDIATDTIYSYTSTGILNPLLVRKPSAHDMEVPVTVNADLKVPNFLFLTTAKKEFDFATQRGFPRTELVYDYSQRKFYEYTLINKDFPAQKFNLNDGAGTYPGDILYLLAGSEKLIEENEENRVHGKLKEIADNQKSDDNPVLMVIKFKN